jgi:hypothetical protein
VAKSPRIPETFKAQRIKDVIQKEVANVHRKDVHERSVVAGGPLFDPAVCIDQLDSDA